MYKENLIISSENKLLEDKIFIDICEAIDKNESLVFEAGAGSGKTYALIQTLKYIVNNYSKLLLSHNQKIICITYTNVATNELKDRLGNSSLIEISTIHKYLWSIISEYREELLEIHSKKLKTENIYIEQKLIDPSEKWAIKYQKLSCEDKDKLKKAIIENEKLYYEHYNDSPSEFRNIFSNIFENYNEILSNINNIKKIINNILRMNRYENALKEIKSKNREYSSVEYNPFMNNDKLEKMMISHDTSLEYSYELINKYDMLKRFICDKFPFILIDEYQDTNLKVVKIFELLDKYSTTINHPIFIGYFGDVKQNIYGDGIGNKLYELHHNLKIVEKVFNRRSANEIINISNKIRNDGLIQRTIYENFPVGSVNFYNLDIEKNIFVKEHIKKWKINKDNKLHCLELTNRFVAEQSGFKFIYDFFSEAPWYKLRQNYKFISDHILSFDFEKLGDIQKLLYRIIDFKNNISNENSMISEIFPKEFFKNLTILKLRNAIFKLSSINGKTLKEYIENLFKCFNENEDLNKILLEKIISSDFKTYNDIKEYVLKKNFLFNNLENYINEKEKYDLEINSFFDNDIKEFDLWYTYLKNDSSSEVLYHTYHGTKGLEFKNVIIFMESTFGRDSEFFERLFKNFLCNDIIDSKVEEARNLLYVVITRATTNLSILYSGDISESKSNIESIFGEIKKNISY